MSFFNLENNPFDPFLSYCYIPHSCHSLHPMEHEFYEDNEYLSSLPADPDRTEDFEYEVRSFSHHFTLFHEVMVEGFCITKKKLIYYYETYFIYYISKLRAFKYLFQLFGVQYFMCIGKRFDNINLKIICSHFCCFV